jgi:type II secretory pathway component PulJ
VRRTVGFTLLEVLVTIALLILLGGGMFGFLHNLAERRGSISEAGQTAQAVQAFFDRLESDLVAVIAADRTGKSGLVGRRTELTLLTRGVVLDLAQPSLGDMQEASYRFSAASGRLEASRREAGDAGAPEYEIVLADVGKVEFRYHDGREWRRAFDAGRRGRLPHAVEVSIWLTLDEEQAGSPSEGTEEADAEARAEEERMADVYGEEFDDVQMGFDLEDVMEEEDRPDRRRIIVIPHAVAPETISGGADETGNAGRGGATRGGARGGGGATGE